jgi:hypothetical protein
MLNNLVDDQNRMASHFFPLMWMRGIGCKGILRRMECGRSGKGFEW